MSKLLNLISLRPKIEKFCEEFFELDQLNIVETKWAIQYTIGSDKLASGDDPSIAYWPPKCGVCPPERAMKCSVHKRQMTLEHLFDHFSQQVYRSGKERRGTLAFVPNFRGKTKTFFIDFDSPEATEALYTKIIPELDRLGIEFILETPPESTGIKFNKAHLIIKMDSVDIKLLKVFANILMEQLNIDVKGLKLELTPTHKNTLFRLMGGVHLRRNCVYDVTFRDRIAKDVEQLLDFVNECPKVSTEFLKEYIKQYGKVEPEAKKPKKSKKAFSRFHYVPRNLPLHPDVRAGLPEDVKIVATNCQAMNQLFNLVYEDDMLNQDGIHNEGKFIANVLMESDIRNLTDTGETWFFNAINQTRDRPEEKHNWWKKENYLDNPNILIPRCETWESYFDLCEGCIWKNYPHITNPRQLRYGKPINKKRLYDVKLTTVEEIRETTLKEVYERTVYYVQNKEEGKDLLIASPPSAGKTYTSDQLAVDLAAQGFNIMIAVPSGKLAQQHIDQIESMGGNALAMKSHGAHFKTDNAGNNESGLEFACPEQEEITRLVDLGLGSKTIQKKFCHGCRFLEQCPYPGQYSKAALPINNIIIIQHAHFGCRETMFSIFRDKQFDLLIVDEEFISNINKEIKVSALELAVLTEQESHVEWVGALLSWFDGTPPAGEPIKVTESELEHLKASMDSRNCPWNVPEYVTHYNSGKAYDKRLGLFVFFPVPEIPVRLFTDATPPIEMLEVVLDNKNIEVFGKSEVLNLQASNKDNKIVQVLDSSTSKAALAKNEYELFYEILEYIGDDIVKSWPDTNEEILLTLYKDGDIGEHNFTSRAEEWLQRNYPQIFERHKIIFGRMALGTNDYQYCAAQYQVAGMYYNTLELHKAAYKLKNIANFWNRMKGRPQLVNMYPWDITPKSTLETIPMPIYRIEVDPVEGAGFYQYDFNPDKPYEGLYQSVPVEKYLRIVFNLAAAKKQQAMRIIRNKTTKAQKVVIFDKEERPTQATNESVLLHDILGYLR